MRSCECGKRLEPAWHWADCFKCWKKTPEGRSSGDVIRRLNEGQRWNDTAKCWIRTNSEGITELAP